MRPDLDPLEMHRRTFLKGASSLLFTLCAAGLASDAALGAPAPSAPAKGERMRTRHIPSTREPLPVIGMGTSRTFDPSALSPEALAPLEQVLKIFHDGGGRVIDSSPMYGKAETVTGDLTTKLGIKHDLFIATKVWTTGEEAGITQMKDSMQKLKRDKIELMQIHNLIDWKTHLKTVRKWKEEGKFRYIGITHYQLSAFAELEQIMRNEKIDFVQLPYSAGMREAEKRLLPAAQDKGIAVLVMRPFEAGGLMGKLKDKPLPEYVKPFASSWAQALLKFCIAHPAVTCVIPATSKPHHMQDNLQAGFGPLPDEPARQQLSALVTSL